MVTGDDVACAEPHPERYLTAPGVPAREPVAVEDVDNGVKAAKAAAVTCVAVANAYTAGQDLSAADLVIDGYEHPAAAMTRTAWTRSTGWTWTRCASCSAGRRGRTVRGRAA